MDYQTTPTRARRASRTAVRVFTGLSVLVAAVTLAAVSYTANAATDAGSVSPNFNKWLLTMCNKGTSKHTWKLNYNTGSIALIPETGFPYLGTLAAGENVVSGSCSFPESSRWQWFAGPSRISEYVYACNGAVFHHAVTDSISTTWEISATGTFGAGLDYTPLKDVLTASLKVEAGFGWSLSHTQTYSKTDTIDVASGHVGWMEWRPHMLTVRTNPVLRIDYYEWGGANGGGGPYKFLNGWQNKGWKEVSSANAYVDVNTQLLLPHGNTGGTEWPDGSIGGNGRTAGAGDCA